MNFVFFCVFQLRRTGEFVPSTIHHPIPHPIYPSNRLRTFSQFVRVIEETDMQLQRSMRGATRVCDEKMNCLRFLFVLDSYNFYF